MSLESQLNTPLARAVRLAGGQSALGRIIGRRQSSVRYWLENGLPVPAEHVLAIEAQTGVSRRELRPDVYPVEGGADVLVVAQPGAGSREVHRSEAELEEAQSAMAVVGRHLSSFHPAGAGSAAETVGDPNDC